MGGAHLQWMSALLDAHLFFFFFVPESNKVLQDDCRGWAERCAFRLESFCF